MRNLTHKQWGLLKGSLGTSLFFITGISIGLYFLHQKHQMDLDSLKRDTARDCLDFATEHYESTLRRRQKEFDEVLAKVSNTAHGYSDMPQEEIDAMNNYEEPDEEWNAMHAEIDRHIDEFKALEQQLAQKEATCN